MIEDDAELPSPIVLDAPYPPPYWEPLAKRLGLPALRCRGCRAELRGWDFNGALAGKATDPGPMAQCDDCFNKISI